MTFTLPSELGTLAAAADVNVVGGIIAGVLGAIAAWLGARGLRPAPVPVPVRNRRPQRPTRR